MIKKLENWKVSITPKSSRDVSKKKKRKLKINPETKKHSLKKKFSFPNSRSGTKTSQSKRSIEFSTYMRLSQRRTREKEEKITVVPKVI